MTQLKSQILGLMLAFMTALGVIVYEKIINRHSFVLLCIIKIIEAVLVTLIVFFAFRDKTNKIVDLTVNDFVLFGAYIITTIATTIAWYVLTMKQGAMVSALYEFKYIIVMAIIYVLVGEQKFTLNTAIGTVLALLSVYFVSKSQ